MAITLIQQPQRLQPAYNQIYVTASSTNSGEDGFKYVVKIYTWLDEEGAFTQVFSGLVPPNPDGLFAMNIGEIISQYVSHDLVPAEAGFKKCSNSIVRYYVSLNEYYDSTYQNAEVVTGGVSVLEVGFNDTSKLAWNGALTFKDFQSYNDDTYLNTIDNDAQLLTNVTVNKIYASQNSWVYGIYQSPSGTVTNFSCFQARVKTYSAADAGGSLLGTYLINNDYQVQDVSGVGEYMMRFPCGTYNLNQITGGDFNSGAQPIITDSVLSYTVEIGKKYIGSETFYNDVITYNVEDNCNSDKYTSYRLHWLNRLGGFDSFNFNCRSDINDTNVKSTYSKMLGELNGSNNWTYNLYDRTKVNMSSVTQTKVTLNSDNLTESECNTLRELFSSPVVFIEVSATEVYATDVLTGQFTPTLKKNDKVANVTIEVTLPDYVAQRY